MAPKSKTCASSSSSTAAAAQDDNEIKKKVLVKAEETVTLANDGFHFRVGALIEACSDEEGLKGAWFCAKIVELRRSFRFVVEYETLVDDDSNPLREELYLLYIRPRPPKIDDVAEFKVFDEVDAYYNDGWWVGLVSKVLGNSKYVVFFRSFNEEMEFHHSQLRLHQEWMDRRWVMASKALKF